MAQKRAAAKSRSAPSKKAKSGVAKAELNKERERFEKLWSSYQELENELEYYKRRVTELEQMPYRGQVDLQPILRERDARIHALEAEVNSLRSLSNYSELYQKERERLTKLYTVTGDIETELDDVKRELATWDQWFHEFEKNFRRIYEAVTQRVESVKKS